MRYEDSMKGVADQIIKEQQRVSKIINNPEEFHWHDEYATLNFFRFICKNIGNLRNGEIEKMATRLKNIDQKAVENHVNGAVWAFDYDKMFCVLMENEICRKVCEKNKYNSWMNLIGQYCVSSCTPSKFYVTPMNISCGILFHGILFVRTCQHIKFAKEGIGSV